MRHIDCGSISEAAPRNPRNSPAEQTDESPGQIDKDRVEIERETPAGGNEGIERVERDDDHETPAFEE